MTPGVSGGDPNTLPGRKACPQTSGRLSEKRTRQKKIKFIRKKTGRGGEDAPPLHQTQKGMKRKDPTLNPFCNARRRHVGPWHQKENGRGVRILFGGGGLIRKRGQFLGVVSLVWGTDLMEDEKKVHAKNGRWGWIGTFNRGAKEGKNGPRWVRSAESLIKFARGKGKRTERKSYL